jgi:MFS family permease
MNITLNKNSWHFKIYSKVISNTPPKSLCPYFWSMVFIIAFSPYFLLTHGFSYLFQMIPKRKVKYKKPLIEMTQQELDVELERQEKKLNRMEKTGKVILISLGIFALSIIVVSFYITISKIGFLEFLNMLFSIIGFVTTVYFIGVSIGKNAKKIKNSNVVKVPGAMIKAVYTKTCPIINWK